VGIDRCQVFFKRPDIHPKLAGRRQGDRGMGGEQKIRQQAVKPRQFAAEVGARPLLAVGGPQKRGQGIAFVGLAREEQIGQQAPLLAPRNRHRLTMPRDMRGAKQVDLAPVHLAPPGAHSGRSGSPPCLDYRPAGRAVQS